MVRAKKEPSNPKQEEPEDENQVQGTWGSSVEYWLSSIGVLVGFGNIWRFPYLLFTNG